MSSFNCEHCQAQCADTDCGYVTGCEHYPVNRKHLLKWYRKRLQELHKEVAFMAVVAYHNNDGLAEPFLRWQADILREMDRFKSSGSQPARQQVVQPAKETPTGNESP